METPRPVEKEVRKLLASGEPADLKLRPDKEIGAQFLAQILLKGPDGTGELGHKGVQVLNATIIGDLCLAIWGGDPQSVPTPSYLSGSIHLGSVVYPRFRLFVTLLAVVGPVLAVWAAVVTVAGTLFAIMIHAWYDRHPSDIPTPTESQRLSPQINFSSTEVAGDIGGLIFVVGSVFIVAVGLPSVIWFMFAGTVAGCFLAWGLVSWYTSHPKWGLPENRIILR